jgi:hypothetical protein
MYKDTKPVEVSREGPAKKTAKAAKTSSGTSYAFIDDDESSDEDLALLTGEHPGNPCYTGPVPDKAEEGPAPVPAELPEPVSETPRKPGRKSAKKPVRRPAASDGDCAFVVHMSPAVRNLAKTYAAMAGLSLNQYIVSLIVEDARKGTARLQKLVNNVNL